MQVSTSGVVFYYDIANDKSYLGEPTTNFYTNADLTGGNNVGQEGGSNPTNEVVLFPNPGNSPYCVRSTAVGGSIYTEYQLTVTGTIQANTSYTLSCWVAWTPDWDGTYSVFHMRWYNSGGSEAGSSGLEQGTTIETRVVNGLTWYRKYYTFNSGASVNGTHDWYAGYYSNNTKGYRYFTNFQLEAKNHPTQFSKGTRSNTQGLLDLTGNYTTDLTNAAFDSNANMYLSGGKAVKIVSNSSLFSNTFTWSAWHYIIADGGTGYAGIFWAEGAVGGGSGYQYLLSYRSLGSNAYAHYRINNATTGWGNTDTGTLASSMLNRWIYTTWTFNNGTTKIYINGVLSHTDTSRGAYNGGSDSPVYIGARNDLWGSINGYIQQASYHNRALSDSEVLRNFNATYCKKISEFAKNICEMGW